MSGAGPSRWRFAVLPIVMASITLPTVLRDRAAWTRAWPVWRVLILDALLIVAGAVLVAAAAFGVHAWRQAKRGTLA